MSSRDRTCGHLLPRTHPLMPRSEHLVRLAPVMSILMDCASEYDSLDPEPTTIVEWVRWLDLAVGDAMGRRYLIRTR